MLPPALLKRLLHRPPPCADVCHHLLRPLDFELFEKKLKVQDFNIERRKKDVERVDGPDSLKSDDPEVAEYKEVRLARIAPHPSKSHALMPSSFLIPPPVDSQRKDSLTWQSMRCVARTDVALFNSLTAGNIRRPVDQWVQTVIAGEKARDAKAKEEAEKRAAESEAGEDKEKNGDAKAEADGEETVSAEVPPDLKEDISTEVVSAAAFPTVVKAEDAAGTEEKSGETMEVDETIPKMPNGASLSGIAGFLRAAEPQSLVPYGSDDDARTADSPSVTIKEDDEAPAEGTEDEEMKDVDGEKA